MSHAAGCNSAKRQDSTICRLSSQTAGSMLSASRLAVKAVPAADADVRQTGPIPQAAVCLATLSQALRGQPVHLPGLRAGSSTHLIQAGVSRRQPF